MALHPRRTWLALVIALVLLASACSGSSDSEAEDDIFPSDSSADQDGDDESGDEDDGGSDDGGPSGDFQTVFGLPPGKSVETDWAPYVRNETEFGVDESVVFEVTGATVDEIVAFYQESLVAMGYVVDEPLELGGTIALNISDPANPATTAVVQIGESDGVVVVNQNMTVPVQADSPTTSEPAESSTSADGSASGAMSANGSSISVDWMALPSTPFFALTGGSSDPYFHIHTNPETDGFFLSFELFTEWGQAWTGETGTFPISCDDPGSSTGICPYFDPDGPGPEPVLGGDFATTGELAINQLDETGYEIVVQSLVFSDGTTFTPFTMTG